MSQRNAQSCIQGNGRSTLSEPEAKSADKAYRSNRFGKSRLSTAPAFVPITRSISGTGIAAPMLADIDMVNLPYISDSRTESGRMHNRLQQISRSIPTALSFFHGLRT